MFGYARSLIIFHGLVRSAQRLHNSMFSAVLRTPVRFFDTNPIGEPSRPRPADRRPLSLFNRLYFPAS